MNYKFAPILLSVAVLFVGSVAFAEEGMWSYDKLPTEQISDKYGIKFTPQEIDKIKRASVRVNEICSGAFVSPNGLIQTNSHCLFNIYAENDDFGKQSTDGGFIAQTPKNELKLQDFSIQFFDGSIYPDMGTEKANSEELATYRVKYCGNKEVSECKVFIENQSGKLRVDNYKTIKDVRMVFLPEMNIGLFGFMKDNFRFPHYSVDVAYIRAYDKDGKPLNTNDYFKWGTQSPQKGNVMFTSGYPGYSFRNRTYNQVLFDFNTTHKVLMELNGAAINKIIKNNKAPNKGEIFELKNSYDAFNAVEDSINNGAIKKAKDDEEKIVRNYLLKKHNQLDISNDPWMKSKDIGDAKTIRTLQGLFMKLAILEVSPYAMKIAMPEEMLVNEGHDALKQPASFDAASEKIKIASWGDAIIKTLDKDDVPLFLQKNTPDEFADKLIAECPEFFDAKNPVAQKSKSCEKQPSVKQLARMINFAGMKYGIIYGNVASEANSPELIERIKELKAKADPERFDYDDANNELRFSYGQILPEENSNVINTRLGDFYGQETKDSDRILPKRWKDAKAKLNRETPLDFVSTNDVVGGNSGSPIFNKDLVMIGSVFDGNQESAGNMYFFSDKMRTISVSNAAISEALGKVYNMNWLIDELKTGKIQ